MAKTRFMRAKNGAAGSEYAILLGLIAIAGFFVFMTFGRNTDEQFASIRDEIDTATEHTDPAPVPPQDDPQASLLLHPSSISLNGSAVFNWSTSNAQSTHATYTLGGDCQRALENGAGPYPLAWTAPDGMESMTWSADLAGCWLTATLVAERPDASAEASATLDFEPLDDTPQSLSFPAITNAEPGQFSESVERQVPADEVNTSVTIATMTPDSGVALAGTSTFSTPKTVEPDDYVKLGGVSSEEFGGTANVQWRAGSLFGTLTIETREKDELPDTDPANFTPIANATRSTLYSSDLLALSGFDGPISATCGENCAQIGRRPAGSAVTSWSPGSIAGFMPGDQIAIRATSPASYASSVTATVSIGQASRSLSITTMQKPPVSCVASNSIQFGHHSPSGACDGVIAAGPEGAYHLATDNSGTSRGSAYFTCTDVNGTGTWVFNSGTCTESNPEPGRD